MYYPAENSGRIKNLIKRELIKIDEINLIDCDVIFSRGNCRFCLFWNSNSVVFAYRSPYNEILIKDATNLKDKVEIRVISRKISLGLCRAFAVREAIVSLIYNLKNEEGDFGRFALKSSGSPLG